VGPLVPCFRQNGGRLPPRRAGVGSPAAAARVPALPKHPWEGPLGRPFVTQSAKGPFGSLWGPIATIGPMRA